MRLTRFYITVHNIDEAKNAAIYRVKIYPPLKTIIDRIHDANLLIRANMVLSKRTVGTAKEFASNVDGLVRMGVDSISTWPIRDLQDKVDKVLSPDEAELDKMESWIERQSLGNKVKILREKNREAYQSGEKLTLFPDGTLSNTWCN